MKLHLPSVLRKALLLVLAAVSATLGIQSATASLIFDGVGIQTYADFGQNCGRFVAGEVNAMLDAIRKNEGGIVITYQASQYGSYTISLEQGMIDFASASSNPVAAAVGYAYLATVSHNGVIDPTYTALEVGGQNAVRYSSIDFKRGTPFHMEAATDYKIARLNKIVTDVQPSEFYSGTNPGAELDGEFLYRTGAGAMDLALIDADGIWRRTQELDLPYSFATGGIVVVEWADNPTHIDEHDGNFGIFHHVNPKFADEIADNPLPYRVRSGDSGSPTWVYNTTTKTYQYISAGQSGGTYFSQDRGDLKWSEYTLTKFNVTANLGSGSHTVTINPVTETGETITGVGDDVAVSTTRHYGSMQYADASGTLQTKKFVGIENGKHTWLDLSEIRDDVNWFNYGDKYFNVSKYTTEGKDFCFADMFETNSLVFNAEDTQTYNVELAADVDLGVGFVQFSKSETLDTANFNLTSEHLLDSAGFAIDKGVTLELDMKAPEERMVEWRKAGAGNLRITGSGDTNALLNVGGSGTVSLEREDGYAAYNVLASSGSTLVVKDLKQVYRDVTLGAGGATLDLNGNNFTWNNSATPDGSGFKSLHLLVEKDVVTNKASQAIQITILDPGDEAFVGAFKDTAEGAINVVYTGDSEKTWVMNTVFTDLQNNAASSFTVQQGSVVLQGINTVHARQLLGRRVVNYFDWHYADAKMDVVVQEGAEFTLGSHARLKGDVTVEDGGVFTMKEYTTHQHEYMEGGVNKDDTYQYREYFGLHGNINLEGVDSMFNVQFSPQNYYEDTDSQSVYDGKITGSGSMMVDTAGGSLKLTNAGNNFTGSKELVGGTLVATTANALGNTVENKWIIHERGVLAVEKTGIADALGKIDGASNGVLALTQDASGNAPDLSEYQDLIIGAVGNIQFGDKGTQDELASNDSSEWHLGGGGGNLYVNYKLNDEDGVLVLGNQYTTGLVILTNAGNKFSRIQLVGGVTLSYDTLAALGGASLSLNYGNRIMGDADLIGQLTEESNGVVLIDNMATETIDLSGHGHLSLAADKKTTFTGSINLGDNTTYHFGGGAGHLILDTVLTDVSDVVKRDIVVDAQFYTPPYSDDEDFSSAGVVELKRVSQATGTVTVQGYDAAQIPDPDDPLYILSHFSTATLQLSVDNALANAESIVLKDGGFIDINGTKQTFKSLHNEYPDEVVFGAYGVVDYSEKQNGELVLNVEDGDLWDPLFCNLAVPTLTKTGEGELMMVNVNESSLFTIKAGTVNVYEGQALNSRGVTRVEGTGVLDVSELGEELKNKTIELNNGGTMLVGADAISGSISVNEGTGTLNAVGNPATLNAPISAAENATLELQGSGFTLKKAKNNVQGGTIDLQAAKLSLNCEGGLFIGGTLQVSNNATLANSTGTDDTVHEISRLYMVNNATLDITGNKKSLIWNIHQLDGAGTINWKAGDSNVSSLRLDGEGSFSGTLQVQGGASTQDTPSLLLAHDRAAQNSTVSLQGASASSVASMALASDNIRIGGLNGNTNSVIFADESASNVTLTSTGAGEYTYSGTIGSSSAMNLVMDGTGSQTYAGTVQASNVAALQGTLSLQGDHISIAGDVTVARGATLTAEKGLTLSSGQYLCSSGVEGSSGIVNGAVNFSGGSLSFDAAGLNAQTAALEFTGGGTHQNNMDVVFTSTNCLTAGSSLLLTSGYDWSNTNFTASQLEYLDASFTRKNSELWVEFTQKAGNVIWDGTSSQHTWSTSRFGQLASGLQATDTAVFNDSAESQTVQMSGNVTAKALLFDNSKEYTVNTTGGAKLSAGQVNLQGSGDVTLGAGVTITGAAEIAEGSTLVLQDTNTLGADAKVNGAGTLAVDTDSSASLDGKLTHIGSVELRRGTLSVGQPLNADDMVVNRDAELHATTGSILANSATVHSSGTLKVTIAGTANLANAVEAGANGDAGTFVKEGAGTLNVSQSLVANTVLVNAGTLQTSNKNIVPGFLENMKRLEVNKEAKAYIGYNAYTIPDRAVTTEIIVDGGRLELAIAQNTTRTITGDVTVKNGGTLYKVDGGLILGGKTTFADDVTLLGSWGKAGTIFNGKVEGFGHVQLRRQAKDNAAEQFTFNNGTNTFSGEIEATAGTKLVAGHKTALATASNINLNGGSLVLAANEVDVKSLSGNGVLDINAAAELPSATLNVEEGNFSGTVEANVSITKSGEGNFTLSGDTSKSSGTLTVKAGTLTLDTATLGTPETIVSGGTLALTSTVDTISGSLTVTNGATLKLVERDVNAVYAGGLTLDSGAILDVTALNISTDQSASITLIKGGNIASPADVKVDFGSLTPAYYALAVENNNLMLTFIPPAQDLIWDGKANSNWSNDQGDKNWHVADAAVGSSSFASGANVQFNAGKATVALTDDITVGTMTLVNDADVTINGNSQKQDFNNVVIQTGAALNLSESSVTTVEGSVTLDGTLNNNGNLTISQGSVSSDATGVIGGTGETTLSGTIENAGTVVLANADLTGSDKAAITGNVVINGGTLSGTMELGSEGSKVAVANMFTLNDAATYTIKGDLVLDALKAVEIVYIGAEWDVENNGFMAYAAVQAYTETTGKFTLADGACATYKGASGIFEDGLFTCEDFSTFHVNVGELGMETYTSAMFAAEEFGFGDDFKNVRLAAGTGFELDSKGAALEKVTVGKGEATAELAVSNAAVIDAVEMGSDLSITGEASLQIGSVQASASETLTVNGPTVTVTGDMENFHGSIDVESGVLNIMNAASVNVRDVTINNATLGVYKGAEAPDIPVTENEGTLTIKNAQRLTAKGAGATLNANLVMEEGSILDVHGTEGTGLTLGSTLTLNHGIHLSASDLANVMGLMGGESYTLFNGVDSLTLGQTYTEAITPEMQIDAADWFHGVEAKRYYMVYDGSNVGSVAIFSATPEPTTSTLSLLALAALAARRRRK